MKIGLVAGRIAADARIRAGAHFDGQRDDGAPMGWSVLQAGASTTGGVVGVVRDFNFPVASLSDQPALALVLSDDPQRVAEARRPLCSAAAALIRRFRRGFHGHAEVRRSDSAFDPGSRSEYELLDELSRHPPLATDAADRDLAALCIFISCLGLYGLTAFVTERRSCEIALRKVLGASAWQVVLLLARRTILLTCIGGVVAVAIAWLVMDQWLSGFAYRVSVNPFLLSVSDPACGGWR